MCFFYDLEKMLLINRILSQNHIIILKPLNLNKYNTKNCQLQYLKSGNLLDRARFNGSSFYIRYPEEVERLRRNGWKGEFKGERCIIFVSTIKERDERFVQKLDMVTPGKYPYNRSILELIRSGKNIITTQALWSIFNEETIAAFKESDYLYTAFFDEVPPLFREVVGNGRKRDDFGELVAFGPSDVKLMQREEMLVNVKGQLQFNAKCEYNKKNSEHKVFDAVKQLSRSAICILMATRVASLLPLWRLPAGICLTVLSSAGSFPTVLGTVFCTSIAC